MHPKQSARTAFLDVAKGLGIVAVVAGHIYPPGALHSLIYFFHMPLFFFISGYLFKVKEERVFINGKLKQLMVPYFSFLLLVYTVQLLDPSTVETLHPAQMPLLYFKALLGGRWLYGYTTAFWFLPVLFFVLILANRLLQKASGGAWLLAGLLSLVAATCNSIFFPGLKVPLNANVILAALPVFLAGFYCKKQGIKYGAVAGGIILAIAVPVAIFDRLPAMDMKMALYGFPLLSLAAAIPVCLLVFALSKKLANHFRVLATGLSALGQASLVIMFLHQPVQILLHHYVTADSHLRFATGLLMPYLLYRLFRQHRITRVFFLGAKDGWPRVMAGLPQLPPRRLPVKPESVLAESLPE